MKWTVFSGITSSAVSVLAITEAACSWRIRQAFSPKVSPWRSVASGYSVPSSLAHDAHLAVAHDVQPAVLARILLQDLLAGARPA